MDAEHPPSDGPDETAGCVVCGLVVPYTRDPLFCADCDRWPFSNPLGQQRARRAHLAALGLPEDHGLPFLAATAPGEAYSRRYAGMTLVVEAVPAQWVGRHEGGALVVAAVVKWAPLRELVFFRDTAMYVEASWHHALANHVVEVHRLDYAHLVEYGKDGKTRPGATPRWIKLATDLLAITSPVGRPARGPASPEDLRQRSDVVARAEAYKARYPTLTWDQIARQRLGIPPGRLDEARRRDRQARAAAQKRPGDFSTAGRAKIQEVGDDR